MIFTNHFWLFFAVVIITALVGQYLKSQENNFEIENFSNFNNIEVKEHFTNIYDKFYSKVYDTLFNSDLKNEFELYNIQAYTIKNSTYFKPNQVRILDIGCGTGKHLSILKREKVDCVGMDKSMKMLQVARKLEPTIPLVKGDFHTKSTFKNREFSHIICMFYTIYYSEYPDKIFRNANFWLQPNGFFCVHLVNKDKFDPVLESSSKLIPLFNPQKHSHSRVTQTKLKFDKFKYMADWKFENDNVEFIEHFVFNDDSHHRQNKHKMLMKPIKFYTKLAKKNGFKLVRIIDLLPANHDNNYIYIFQKKYGL
tara:strand:- start:10784 stop:11713 length:930 start_codon:yes stop_codon:yes gene_type:complete